MSISALSSNLITDLSQPVQQNPFQQIRQDFKALAGALQSGNLQDAQSAYSNIQQVLQANQGSSNSNARSNGSSAIQNDFTALGQALQSGDLSQAQSVFSQLQSDARASQAAPAAAPAGDQYVSSSSQGLSAAQQVQQDYAELASSLQSGDLTGAQSAFASLQQALASQGASAAPSAAQPANSSTGPDPIANDFSALGQALSSGSLSQAQSAFSQLRTDVQSASPAASPQSQSLTGAIEGHHRHHRHGDGESTSLSSTSTAAYTDGSAASSYGSGVNIYG